MAEEKGSTAPAASVRAQSSAAESDPLKPILIDLGSRSKKAIKKLKRGEGSLLQEALDELENVRQTLPEQYKGKLLPVLLVYRQKQESTSSAFPFISPFSLLGK